MRYAGPTLALLLGAAPAQAADAPGEFLLLGTRGHHGRPLAAEASFEAAGREGCRVRVAVGNRAADAPLAWTLTATPGRASVAAESPANSWAEASLLLPPGTTSVAVRADGPSGEADAPFVSDPVFDCGAGREKAPPNIILISLDTLRADRLASYGNPHGLMPVLDAVARDSVQFDQAYSAFPNTLASHATMFTALQPSEHGLRHSEDLEYRLAPEHRPLATLLQDAGYATAAFTEDAYVGSEFGFHEGFDSYDDGDEASGESFLGSARRTFDMAAAWLARNGERPYFLFVHTYQVHTPYTPDRSLVDAFTAERNPGFTAAAARDLRRYVHHPLMEFAYNARTEKLDEHELRQVEILYDAETVGLDLELGRFFRLLDALPERDRTIVVITSDHGDEFSEHGYLGHGETLHEGALHVPLLFWAPALFGEGRHVAAPVGLVDVAPTLAELAGLPGAYPGRFGESVADLVRGEAPRTHRGIVLSSLDSTWSACPLDRQPAVPAPCPDEFWSLRDGKFTFIRRVADGSERLYDRAADPGEHDDLASRYPEVTARLRSQLESARSGLRPQMVRREGGGIAAPTEQRLKSLGYIQ